MHLEHEHTHIHEHTHDGVTHTHEHSHEHPHDHAHTPMDELLVLMKYMVDHNAAHTKELEDLADRLKHTGSSDAYEKVMAAVTDFEKGNARLADVLESLKTR